MNLNQTFIEFIADLCLFSIDRFILFECNFDLFNEWTWEIAGIVHSSRSLFSSSQLNNDLSTFACINNCCMFTHMEWIITVPTRYRLIQCPSYLYRFHSILHNYTKNRDDYVLLRPQSIYLLVDFQSVTPDESYTSFEIFVLWLNLRWF